MDEVVALIFAHGIDYKTSTIQEVTLISETPFSDLTNIDGGTSIAALSTLVREKRHGARQWQKSKQRELYTK